jgi:hypothetical protein
VLLTAALVVSGWVAWSNLTAFTLHKTIVIHSERSQIWAVLTDLGAYRRWNPFMISASGVVRTGATVHITLRDAYGGTMTFSPRIEVVRPGRELRWIGRVGIPGIVDGEHDFVLTDVGPGLVRVTQQESFSGVLVPFLHGSLDDGTLPQFAKMDRALANLAERQPATATLRAPASRGNP